MKQHIPNMITCLNLFSGCVGVVFALEGQPEVAAYLVVLAGIFDFFDGLAARALGVHNPIGKQLDSLADVVSFGLLPGAILYTILGTAVPTADYLPYFGFIVTVFSALRLAKFNIDERQSTDFIGLNTPMNAFYVASLPFIAQTHDQVVYHPAFLVGSIVVTSLLLVSEVRLFSMKMSSLSWHSNRWRFIFIIISVLLIGLLKFVAVPIILVLYFLFSYIHFKSIT
ncbi:CDP-diacylglycerol--serine O-phosphatidyltransferase [Parapedobacter lycopersici]|uniref:CDP-diacylglycerol--serine O-phosphatidyltransferase n=1 Tax=Parapedobacter lycopersici TaxID=1864939 RepID=UPI00214DDDA1|nr:CDP-diacylglycerol--serine O-phosphatidyltransferase [Parapedobacter lycopersici]